MAKKKNCEPDTIDMFPVDPIIRGLGIVDIKLKDGEVIADLRGRTLVSDIAGFSQDTWRKALAEYIVALCGNGDNVIEYINEARQEYWERQRDIEAEQLKANETAMRNNLPHVYAVS